MRIGVFQLQRRALRRDPAVVEQDNVARVRSLLHIMRGEEDRQILLLPQARHDLPQQTARLRIKARRRLIQNKQARPVQQGARNVDAAALAARELADGAAQQLAQLQQVRQLRKTAGKCRAPDAVKRRAAAQILLHGQRLIQHRALEHHAEAPAELLRRFVRVCTADAHTAAVAGQLAAENVDGRGFSRAVHAEESE